jgi:hypothetical protein
MTASKPFEDKYTSFLEIATVAQQSLDTLATSIRRKKPYSIFTLTKKKTNNNNFTQ